MAVYTPVPAETMAALLADYGLGALRSAKGIAEGVENSNYLVDAADGGRFILTLYEKRVDPADLPFFLALLDHLADRGLPVPRALRDGAGRQVREVCGRPACLIEFKSGVSVTEPTPDQCRAAATALGRMHKAARDFAPVRANSMGIAHWRALADRCRLRAHEITPRLAAIIDEELDFLEANWPHALERSTIHADLFPDNVLMLDGTVTGLIDFYFACTDLRAYDLAVMHTSWCFSADATEYLPERAKALRDGYLRGHPLARADIDAFAILCRGACLRFLLSRTYDWLNTPADALVTRKDPMHYVFKLSHYAGVTGPEALGFAGPA